MKKLVSLILLLTIISITINPISIAGENIKVILNGNALVLNQPAIIQDGRTLVPIRSIAEAMGAEVGWYDGTIAVIRNNDILYAFIGQHLGILNNKSIYFDVSPTLINGRTVIPVRAICEAFGATVTWDNFKKTVDITYTETNTTDTQKVSILNENVLRNLSVYYDVDIIIGTFDSPSNIDDYCMIDFGIITLYSSTGLTGEDFECLGPFTLIPKSLLNPIFERYFGIIDFTPDPDCELVYGDSYIVIPKGWEGLDFVRISQIRTYSNGNTIIELEFLVTSEYEIPEKYYEDIFDNGYSINIGQFYKDWVDGKLPEFEPTLVREMTFDPMGHIIKYVNINNNE